MAPDGPCKWLTRIRLSVLLKDEQSELDLASPTLPVLKMLTSRAFEGTGAADETLPRVLNGMLSACLLNFDAVR